MALFVASLAYPEPPALLDQAKLGTAGSLTAGIAGAVILLLTQELQAEAGPGADAASRR